MEMKTRIKWCLINVPDQQGVVHIGGRLGTVRGPLAFQKIFHRFQGEDRVLESMIDAGSPNIGVDIQANHLATSELIFKSHRDHGLSVVVGGGHDHGHTHLKGIYQALEAKLKRKPKLGCINLDAHFDLRKPDPIIMSGSPFYLSIEEGILDPSLFVEFGIQRHCNAKALWEYARSKKIQTILFDQLRNGKAVEIFQKTLRSLSPLVDELVISFDLDAVASAYAPGVSAPQAEGFHPSEILEMMKISGREPKVNSLGIFELNPEHDIEQRTARLAATSAYHFISSALSRKK